MAFMHEKMIEGVPYYKYLIRYTLKTGQRRRMVRWFNVIDRQRVLVGRELDERFGIEAIKPGSVTINAG